MEILNCKTEKEIAEAAYAWCEKEIARTNAKSIYIPAGGTPIPLYRLWEQRKPAYLKGIKLLQIDEIITGAKKDHFKKFLQEHLPSYVNQIEWISEKPKQADVAILGLGLNGHIAFHEPHMPPEFAHGEVKLDETTKQRLDMPGNHKGLTYGLGHFLKCQSILMIASGSGKKDIYQRFHAESQTFPATRLKESDGFSLINGLED